MNHDLWNTYYKVCFYNVAIFSMTQKMKKMRSNNGTLIYIFFVNLHVQHIIPFYHNHIHVCFLIRMLHLEKWSFFDMKTTSLTLRKRKPRKIPTQKIWIDFMLMKSEKFFMFFKKNVVFIWNIIWSSIIIILWLNATVT